MQQVLLLYVNFFVELLLYLILYSVYYISLVGEVSTCYGVVVILSLCSNLRLFYWCTLYLTGILQINGVNLAEIEGGEVAVTNLHSCNGLNFVVNLHFSFEEDKDTSESPSETIVLSYTIL